MTQAQIKKRIARLRRLKLRVECALVAALRELRREQRRAA